MIDFSTYPRATSTIKSNKASQYNLTQKNHLKETHKGKQFDQLESSKFNFSSPTKLN